MPFQSQALNDLAATVQGAAAAATQANALAANAQQKNELIIAGDAVETNTDYTMDGTKSTVIADTATASADITITLPDAALNGGKMFWIKRTTGVHQMAVLPQGSQTIDGMPGVAAGVPNVSIMVVAVGDNWFLLSPLPAVPMGALFVTGDVTIGNNTLLSEGQTLNSTTHVMVIAPAANTTDVTVTLPYLATDGLTRGQLLLFRNNSAHDLILAAHFQASPPQTDTINGQTVASPPVQITLTVAAGKTITLTMPPQVMPAGFEQSDWIVVGNDTAP